MENDVVSLTGLLLLFVLGLRHGLDPDHIAMIDAMTYRAMAQRPGIAPWVGTLFAAGHGLAVTAIAVVISMLARDLQFPDALRTILDWLPVALLVLVGTLNLRALLAQGEYRPVGWKKHFVPRRLRDSSHPMAVFSIGVVFALVFDTATQAAAWGYVATAQAGTHMALIAGLVFTVGMMITDTLDGRLMCRLLRRASDPARAQRYRRGVGWLVVALAYGVAIYSIAAHFYPAIELDDAMLTGAGIGMFALMLIAYLWLVRRPAHGENPI
jgi:high-affinity nickel-transport protein